MEKSIIEAQIIKRAIQLYEETLNGFAMSVVS